MGKNILKWLAFFRGKMITEKSPSKHILINPFSAKDVLIDFTLSNARRFYSSKGNPLALKGLRTPLATKTMKKNFFLA